MNEPLWKNSNIGSIAHKETEPFFFKDNSTWIDSHDIKEIDRSYLAVCNKYINIYEFILREYFVFTLKPK